MTPDAPLLLLKLFGVDRPGPGHSLQYIRDKIYSHAWSRIRRDDHKLDFVISETGINRNVPERLISNEGPCGTSRAPRMPPPTCDLHLVNKQVSRDFVRYIYSVNDLEVDVDLKPVHTNAGQVALDKIITLLSNPNFKRFTRTVRVRIHFPAEYPAEDLPSYNQAALENIAFALDDFQNLGHLAIRMVPGQGTPMDYELRVAAFPFYPLRMTNWSIRILNADSFPYTWDIVNAQKTVLLNQAYENYQQTGSLTTPILPNRTDLPNSRPSDKSLRQSSSSARQPTNGSKKRRGRKNRAAEAAKQSFSPSTRKPVNLLGSEAAIIDSIETGIEEQLLHPEFRHGHPTTSNTSAEEQSVGPAYDILPVSLTEHSPPTSAPSPPLSTAQEKQEVQVPGSIDSAGPSTTKSSVNKPASNAITPDHTEDKAPREPRPSTPDSSNFILTPSKDGPACDHVNRVVGAVVDMVGSTTQLQQANKKQRNKRKKPKSKSQSAQSAELNHDADYGKTVEFEVQLAGFNPEHLESSNELALRPEKAPAKPSSSESDRLDLSRGEWSVMGDSCAVFTPKTGPAILYARTPRIERYLRQQQRLLAGRAEARERQKQAKAKNQTRKARQLLLRRDHVAFDSPLLRAVQRPRDNVKLQLKSKSRSPSPTLDEEVAKTLVSSYFQMEANKRELEGKMRECERIIGKYRGSERVFELQDNGQRSVEHELGSGSSTLGHRFEFDTGTGDDASSIDSLAQERPESVTAEDFDDHLDGKNWTESINCNVRSRRLSGMQRGRSEPHCLESLTSQTSDAQQFAEDHTSMTSKGSLEKSKKHQFASPARIMLVPQGGQDVEWRSSDTGTAVSHDLEGFASYKETSQERMLGCEHDPGDVIDFPSGRPLVEIYPEYGLEQRTVSEPLRTDNCLVSPAVPTPLRMPSHGLPYQGTRDVENERDRCSSESLSSKTTQGASDTGQQLLESGERPLRVRSQSTAEAGDLPIVNGQLVQ